MGHKQISRDVRVTSALPPIADIRRMSRQVRYVPSADIGLHRQRPARAERCFGPSVAPILIALREPGGPHRTQGTNS